MKILFKLIFLLVISLSCFGEEYKIAYNEGNKIITINQDGKELGEIILPREINFFSFTSKRDKVVYDSSFRGRFRNYMATYRRVFIYDIEKKIEIQLTDRHYIYTDKREKENESHFNPDISPDGKYVALVVALEEPETKEVCEQEAWHDTLEIGIIEVETRKFIRVTNNDYPDNRPIWSPDSEKIFFDSYGLLRIYNFKNKKMLLVEDTEKKEIGFPLQWVDNTSLLVRLGSELKIYDFISSKEEIILDFSHFKEKGYGPSFFEYVPFLHMSKDRRYIVFEKKYKIYLIDLLSKEIKIIKELRERKLPIYPLEQSICPRFIE